MFEEVDDPAQLPLLPWLVRRRGRAVAAYERERQALEHARTDPDLAVDYDHWAAQNPPPRRTPWQTDR